MQLDTRALALAMAVVWGGCILLVGLAHLVWPSYGGGFLELAASIYPGYQVAGVGSVIVGTLYGAIDGAVGGAVFAWCYNRFSGTRAAA